MNSSLVAPTVTPNSGTVDQGRTCSLTSTAVSTGSSPYSYQWFEEAPGSSFSPISGAVSNSYNFVTSGYTVTGSWSFELQVTDSAGTPVTVTSVAASVVVNVALTVSVSPSSWVMDVGQSETFTAAPSGGSGSYTGYQWYVNGSAQSSQVGSTFSFAPASGGTYLIGATVTDSSGATSQSSTAPVSVATSPSVSITPPVHLRWILVRFKSLLLRLLAVQAALFTSGTWMALWLALTVQVILILLQELHIQLPAK